MSTKWQIKCYIYEPCRTMSATMGPGSSDPFYIASLLYKMGHYFLYILYKKICRLFLF